MASTTPRVGSRVYCDGEYATVLYVGAIEELDGTWLGVEWDNPSRGKHSGTHKNITYFNTRIPNSASFIRITRAHLGRSCSQAIIEKYGNTGDYANTVNFINLPQKTGKERHVEIIGMEKIIKKQSKFSNLIEVGLSNMLINGAGEEGDLRKLVANVNNLDLSQNLLSSWKDVAEIAHQLSSLQTLMLSKNQLSIPEEPEIYQPCFALVKVIVLNDMSYSWRQILSCASMWPYTEELLASDNRMTYLEEPLYPTFCQLRILNLDNNPIERWNEVCKLGKLTSLEELHIENISLESISFSDVPSLEKTDTFPNLKCLYIRNNKLAQWKDISELNKLVKLKELMVNNNPVILSVDADTARQHVIAKIAGLETLNRTKIDRSERRGAELDYIKLHRNEWLENGGRADCSSTQLSADFLANHPTYLTLILRHGIAEESEVKPQNSLLKNNLIYIEIFSPLLPDKPAIKKKLPAEMTVGKIKALVQRIFKIAAQNITLTCVNTENESQKMEMDNDLRQLSFYSLTEKDKISVEW